MYSNEIETENIPTLQPPLSSPSRSTLAGLMLKDSNNNHSFSPVSLKSTHASAKVIDLVCAINNNNNNNYFIVVIND